MMLNRIAPIGAMFTPGACLRPTGARGGLRAISLAAIALPALAIAASAAAQDAPPVDRTAAVVLLPSVQVSADRPSPADRRIGGTGPGPCIAVDIAGDRAGHLDCATERLQDAVRIAQEQARAAIDTPHPQAGSPDVTIGVANQTATRQRMGNAFGVSVHPQRPARPAPLPRGGLH